MISCTLTEELVSDGGPIGKPEIVKSKRRPAENEFLVLVWSKSKHVSHLLGKNWNGRRHIVSLEKQTFYSLFTSLSVWEGDCSGVGGIICLKIENVVGIDTDLMLPDASKPTLHCCHGVDNGQWNWHWMPVSGKVFMNSFTHTTGSLPPCIRMGGLKDNFNFDHFLHFSQYTKVRLG